MDGTIIGQGTFTSNFVGLTNPHSGNAAVGTANPTVIQIPSNADWVKVYDYTQFGTAGNSGAYFSGTANAQTGIRWYWQRGMAAGTGIAEYYSNGAQSINGDTLVSGGFTLYDPSGQTPGALAPLGAAVATTASTNATRPVVSTANTAGLAVGSVVRLSGTAQLDINGIDFVVGAVVANTSFTLMTASNALATAPGLVGGAGFYRQVNYIPEFYPDNRVITNITQAANGQVSTSVAHGYAVGQSVRFNIPSVSGMTQLNATPQNNYQTFTVFSVVDDYNFTINASTSGFTAFTYPTSAQEPVSPPMVVPVGEDTAGALIYGGTQVPTIAGQQIYNTNTGILSDSTVNTAILGMILGSGGNGTVLTTPIYGPAGSIAWTAGNAGTGDSMYWVAGKSTYGGL